MPGPTEEAEEKRGEREMEKLKEVVTRREESGKRKMERKEQEGENEREREQQRKRR